GDGRQEAAGVEGQAQPRQGGPLQVRIAADGVVRVVDGRGMIRLRLGLPGRPLRAWRDGGRPVEDLSAIQAFGTEPPLARGLGALPVGAPDFRPALEGLLWILCDDGRTLTVVLPATTRVVYLPLPTLEGRELTFHPDRLEMREPGAGCWSLPWLTLLPQFIQLGQAGPARSTGTALVPFPRD
ncbi:MAG TPA: hypothetical protein VK188_16460, partial [Holophaga sp.]|nr:hypothetical protein [Holophaga sp.]